MLSDNVTTTGGETKKSSKPVMEKRRRARINASLTELKSLLLEVIKKEGTRHSKMEKADILELTVRHLGQLQKEQVAGMASSDPSGYNKYRIGFNDCFTEMSQYLSSEKDIDVELRVRILNHLSNYLCERSQTQQPSCASSGPGGQNQQMSGCTSAGSDVQGKVTNATSLPTCAPQRLLNSVPPPTLVQLVNSSAAPTILSSLTSVPSTSHDRPIVHLATTVPPAEHVTPVTVTHESEVPQSCQTNVVHSSEDSINRVNVVSTENNIIQNLHILPTKLTSGGMTYVLPTNVSVLPSGSIPSYVIPVFTSPELASGSAIGSQQPLSLATIATPPVTSRLIKGDESSPHFNSLSANSSAFVPEVKRVVPNQGFVPLSTGKLSNSSNGVLFPSHENQDSKPTVSTLSSVRHVSPLSGLPLPVSAAVVREVPEVAQERSNMAEQSLMWRPW